MTEEVKNYVEEMGRTFEEFKSTMETRLTEIESKGHADPLTETKLENIEGDLDKLEDFNQKLTLQEQEYKQLNEKLDRFETMLKRPDAAVETATVDTAVKAFDAYLISSAPLLDVVKNFEPLLVNGA